MSFDFIGALISWMNSHLMTAVKIAAALAAIAVSYYVAELISSRAVRKRLKAPPEVVHNFARGVKWSIVALGFLIALSVLGINLSGILVAAGFTGIVVGLALQQTLSQLFSGISLLLEGRIRVGDSVMIGTSGGVVENVGLMTTQIRAWSGEIISLPNNNVFSNNVTNFSKAVARRADFVIGISYASDIDKALSVIRSVLEKSELVLIDPPPTIWVDSLADSSVNIKVMFWVPMQHYWTVRSDMIKEIKKALDRAGIEIPFPQRVVWLRKTEQTDA